MKATLLAAALLIVAGHDAPAAETAWPDYEIDAAMAAVLERIRAAGPFDVPDLGERKDKNYALTPGELEPFGGVRPFREHFLEQMAYTGPGRAKPEPSALDVVRLGFIGPIEATVSVATGGASHEEALGIQMLRGARLAVEEANDRGGYLARSIPFELVVANDNGLWGASGNEIVDLAYEKKVWAILGTIDGANSHIAIRVALKAEVPMINSGDTDPTFIETNIPWVVRVIGDDRQMGYLLVDYLYRKLGLERVGIIRSSNRYGRFGVRELRDGSRRLGFPVVLEMAYELGSEDYSLQLERLAGAGVEAVVHWGDAADGARILNQMRRMGMRQPFFANDRAVSDEFVEIAGANAEGVVCTHPWNPARTDRKLEVFRLNFRRRFGVEPDTYAAHAYDGMNMVIWATQAAGLNRAKIRDVLAAMKRPWPGVTGDIPLTAALDDGGEVFLARFTGGAWTFLSRAELGLVSTSERDVRQPDPDSTPYRVLTDAIADYAGPGRNKPPPEALEEIRIGWFAPGDPAHPTGGDSWLAASLAVEEANRAGGLDGVPYRLVPAWAADPWGDGAAGVARLAYDDEVWAILGSIDGAATHLAEQVVAKARLALLNPLATDGTVNYANVAWTFSLLPQDTVQVDLLADAVAAAARPIVVLSATDHDSRRLASAIGRVLTPDRHLEFEPGAADANALAATVIDTEAATVVLLAGPLDAARVLVALREAGSTATVFGGPSMGSRAFLERAGPVAAGARYPLLCELSPHFAGSFAARTGRVADCFAGQAYDGVRLLLAAVERAGLNRARIRDALRELAPWSGVAGTVEWSPVGQNLRRPVLASH